MTVKIKYPLGIQTFSEIREENYIYIDKTPLIYDLVTTGKVYFLSRPRRFGKSLLVSTLHSLFNGDSKLFDGLAISKTDYDFSTYPVLKFEFSSVDVNQADDLKQYIINTLDDLADSYGLELIRGSYDQRFAELVRKLHQKTAQKVVMLIDEYDKPILSNLDNPAFLDIKQAMNAFYSVAKSLDAHLKFAFITGVSKFAKVSVFSGMNNLTDISMDKHYACLCGVTEQELTNTFTHPLVELAAVESTDLQTTLDKIKYWYNGYHFHQMAEGVYNPYSILCLLNKQEFKNYWYATATPTFLLDLLQKKQYDLSDVNQFNVVESIFDASEPEDMEVVSLLLQTGYLTVKSYQEPYYRLDFPNFEVRKSFYDSVICRYSHIEKGFGQVFVFELVQQINKGDVEGFITTLKRFFANIPYDITVKQEKYYQSLFYAIFKLLGLSIEAEVRTNDGRIDCVIITDDRIYIIEFKLDDSKEAALQQIIDKQYAQKYQHIKKEIILLGVEFNQDMRNIGGYTYVNANDVEFKKNPVKDIAESTPQEKVAHLVTFNYQDCNFELQGSLNRLIRELSKTDNNQESLEPLQDTTNALEEIENCNTPTEVKKSGVGAQVKELLEQMSDKNSRLYKTIEGTKNGIAIAQDIATKYNSLAEWAGLPQVPKPF